MCHQPAFNSLPLFLSFHPSFLSRLSISHTVASFTFSSFTSQTSLVYLFPLSCKRCGLMPITLLSDRKTAQDSGHHIFMWNEAHHINYSPLSAHTNTACLRVCIQYSMHVHMQMHTWPDNIAALGLCCLHIMGIHQSHSCLSSSSLSSLLRQDSCNNNSFKYSITSIFHVCAVIWQYSPWLFLQDCGF